MGRPKGSKNRPVILTRERHIVERGLDPRSQFPHCDFCGRREHPGTLRLGRWWAHDACAAHPDNVKLATAHLPPLDYSVYANRGTAPRMMQAMLTHLQTWAAQVKTHLRDMATTRGDALIDFESEQGLYH